MSALVTVLEAARYATEAHDGAYRKNAKGEPYVVHPLRVAQRLAFHGYEDSVLLQAAILHDVVEDTETPIGEIEAKFGPLVAALVAEVTDDKTKSQVERKRAQVEHITTISAAAAAIKLSDAIDNLMDLTASTPRGWSVQKVQGYMVWKATIADKIVGMHPHLDSVLSVIFAGKVTVDGVDYPAIPQEPDRATQLEAYYALLEAEARAKQVSDRATETLKQILHPAMVQCLMETQPVAPIQDEL